MEKSSDIKTKRTSTTDKQRKLLISSIAGVVFLILIILAFFSEELFGFSAIEIYQEFASNIADMGAWGKLAIIGMMVAHSFIPFPAEFLALLAGSTYGTVEGTILIWSGAILGASLSFGLTRLFGRPFVEWFLPKRQQAMLNQWADDQGAITLLISRFIPLIAFNLINYAAGLTKISWWTFLWTTGIGILPLTAFMVYMGEAMLGLSWTYLLGISILCILIMLCLSFAIRARKSREN